MKLSWLSRFLGSWRFRGILLPALAAIVVVVALGWGVTERMQRKSLQAALEASYERSLNGAASSVENLEVLLAKAAVSTSPQRASSLLTQSWYQADRAREMLAELPLGGMATNSIQNLLAQSGDYCLSLAQQLAEGRGLMPRQWDELVRLHRAVGGLVERFDRIRSSPRPRGLGLTLALMTPSTDLGRELSAAERDLKQFDALVYDGPYSAHLETRVRAVLPGSQVTGDAAAAKAQQFLADVSRHRAVSGAGADSPPKVASVDAFGGPVPSYAVKLKMSTSPERLVEVDVSQKGGHVLVMMDPRPVGNASIDRQRAEKIARDFLTSQGFADVELTGVNRNGNLLTMSFAPVEHGFVLYPDTLRVTVALDDGQAVTYDALPYWQNHRPRQFDDVRLTPDDIRLLVNPRATVEEVKKAVIRLPGGRESLTYQARLNLDGERFLSFLNAVTGIEESILKVVEGEDRFITR